VRIPLSVLSGLKLKEDSSLWQKRDSKQEYLRYEQGDNLALLESFCRHIQEEHSYPPPWVIHKSQGSEYPAVVIPLAMQHYTFLERNLIYTSVTRGKKLVTIIGQPKALAMAVKNRKSNKRLTKLAARISS